MTTRSRMWIQVGAFAVGHRSGQQPLAKPSSLDRGRVFGEAVKERRVSYPFLSEKWFAEVARIREEMGDLGLPPSVRELLVDLEISDGPEGTVKAHVAGGAIAPGPAAHAPTRLRVPYDVAQKVLISRDGAAAVQAFMAGQAKFEGDLGQLMAALKSLTAALKGELLDRITAITA